MIMKAYKDNSIDICSLYYKEVGHFPPLTADKEKEIRHSVVNVAKTEHAHPLGSVLIHPL